MDQAVRLGYADGTMSWAAAVTLGDSAGAEALAALPARLVRPVRDAQPAGEDRPAQRADRVAVGRPRRANADPRRDGATEAERRAAWLGEQAVAAADGSQALADGFWPGDVPWAAASLSSLR